jgi:acetylglutamate kinase
MKDVGQRATEVAALKRAVPYLRMFRGKTFVLKAGGEAFDSPAKARGVLEQVEALHRLGVRTVLVHGGGAAATELTRALGGEARFAEGRRITDATALQAAVMSLNGTVRTAILATCRALDLPAVGISGLDAGLITARKRPPVATAAGTVDYGFVGDIASVDPALLITLLDAGFVPVVSPLSADADGQPLNINADTVAAALAVALKAEKLLLMTGAPGILERPDDPGSLLSYVEASAIESAIRGGVPRVHILSYEAPDSLLLEIFTNQGCGTLVVADVHALSTAEQGAG